MPKKAKSSNAAPSIRQRKVNAFLQERVVSILAKLGLPESGVMITITAVQVTADLKEAKVWISLLGGNGQQVMRSLKRCLPEIQSEVYHALSMRPVPKLHFALDTSQADAAHIDDVIRSLHDHD